MHACLVWCIACVLFESMRCKGGPEDKVSKISKTLVKWGRIFYKSSLFLVFSLPHLQLSNPFDPASFFVSHQSQIKEA
jgi:hypothetical protein